jgi:hypothetical protein
MDEKEVEEGVVHQVFDEVYVTQQVRGQRRCNPYALATDRGRRAPLAE